MSDHDPIHEILPSAPQTGRTPRKLVYIAVAVAGVALIGTFANSSLGQGLRHHMLVSIPDMTTTAAAFEGGFSPGFGPGFAGWQNGLFNGAIEAMIEAHADRIIRHLAIEIDATAEQQDKLRTIVQAAVKDLVPVRDKMIEARTTARDLLTQTSIDRAALEKLRVDQIAIHDAASKRLVQAVADAAEVLAPEQRRKLSSMFPPRDGPWGRGPWGNWGGFGRR
jgi:Spy/CpxP family protein refolding chaperone